MKYFIATIFAAAALVFCGCSDTEETPPLSRERTQLILRLFHGLEEKDKASTVARAEKLQKILPGNTYLNYVLEVQTANTYITFAQKALDERHDKLALEILSKGLQKHPLNRVLQTQYNNLLLLSDIEKALAAGELKSIPQNLQKIPQYGPYLVRKMREKNIPVERKE